MEHRTPKKYCESEAVLREEYRNETEVSHQIFAAARKVLLTQTGLLRKAGTRRSHRILKNCAVLSIFWSPVSLKQIPRQEHPVKCTERTQSEASQYVSNYLRQDQTTLIRKKETGNIVCCKIDFASQNRNLKMYLLHKEKKPANIGLLQNV